MTRNSRESHKSKPKNGVGVATDLVSVVERSETEPELPNDEEELTLLNPADLVLTHLMLTPCGHGGKDVISDGNLGLDRV